jgi:serine/threonine-protein kinase
MASILRGRRPSFAWSLTVTLALVACSSSSGSHTSPDSGPGSGDGGGGGSGDSSLPPVDDAGESADTGTVSTPDAGSNPDSGSSGTDRFPASSILYQDVSGAALDPNSTAIINHLAASGWGSGNFQIDFSITILHADSSVVPRAFTPASGYYTPDCDMTKVPIPPGGNAEGETDYTCDTSQGDCHVLVYQGARLYELYNTTIAGGTATGSPFTTLCEVVWDLTRDYWKPGTPYSRGDQCTSADAAGMPIAPLLVTGADLQAGVVNHAMRFTLPNASIKSGVYVHPGTHAGGPSGDSMMPPYVSRFRLKSTFDVSTLPNAAAKAVAVALQKYGMFLDDGGNIPLTFDSSAAALLGSHDLFGIQVSDFEIVASPDPAVALTDNCTRTPVTN